MSWALYSLLVAPLAAATASVLGGRRCAHVVTVAAGLASFGLVIAVALHVRHGAVLVTADGWLRVDPLSAVFLLATGVLYAATAIFSVGYIADADARFTRRYSALMNLFCFSLLALPLAADFGTLWVAVELTTIVSALLVAIDRTDAALEAAWKYILIASSGLGIALLAVVIAYAAGTHTLGSAYLPRFTTVIGHAAGMSHAAVRLAFVLACVGFGTKVGLVPMHTWLPDAHSEAPAPASALLSGSLLAGAFYAILRFLQLAGANGELSFAHHVLIVFGVISLATAACFVLQQRNYKRLLAYSSIEHMAIIALGVGFGAPLAIAGALLHVITHACAKGLAFLGAGSLLRGYDTKEIADVRDAGRRMRFTGPIFMGAIVALSGLPLSGVFRSEFEIVVGGMQHGSDLGVVLLLVFVNVAFFGVIWHAGAMVFAAPAGAASMSVQADTADGATVLIGLQAPPVQAAATEDGRRELPGTSAAVADVRERSAWMIVAMLGCAVLVLALGLDLPGALHDLLDSAGRLLEATPR